MGFCYAACLASVESGNDCSFVGSSKNLWFVVLKPKAKLFSHLKPVYLFYQQFYLVMRYEARVFDDSRISSSLSISANVLAF